MKKLGKIIQGIFKLIKLETMTNAGRANLTFVCLLVLFVVSYTTNDMLCYLISAVRDATKTIALKENISDPYITISVYKLLIPILIFSALCMGFLYIDENAKQNIDNRKDKNV